MAFDAGPEFQETRYGEAIVLAVHPPSNVSNIKNILKSVRASVYFDILIIEELLHRELVRAGIEKSAADIFAEIAAPHAAQEASLKSPEVAVAEIVARIARATSLTTTQAFAESVLPPPSPSLSLKLPTSLREDQTYEGRVDRSANPFEVYASVWGEYEEAGLTVYQEDIKGAGDTKLVPAMRSFRQYHPDYRAQYPFPPSRRKQADKILGGLDLSSPEVVRAIRTVARRPQR